MSTDHKVTELNADQIDMVSGGMLGHMAVVLAMGALSVGTAVVGDAYDSYKSAYTKLGSSGYL